MFLSAASLIRDQKIHGDRYLDSALKEKKLKKKSKVFMHSELASIHVVTQMTVTRCAPGLCSHPSVGILQAGNAFSD
jgi:hypothetical protein